MAVEILGQLGDPFGFGIAGQDHAAIVEFRPLRTTLDKQDQSVVSPQMDVHEHRLDLGALQDFLGLC